MKYASLARDGGEDEQVRLGGSHPGSEAAVETEPGAASDIAICQDENHSGCVVMAESDVRWGG